MHKTRLRCTQVAALCIFAGFLALLAATIAAGMLALALLRSPRDGGGAASTAVCSVTTYQAFRLYARSFCMLEKWCFRQTVGCLTLCTLVSCYVLTLTHSLLS